MATPVKKTWVSVVSGQPSNAGVWQAREEAKRKTKAAAAATKRKAAADMARAKKELEELLHDWSLSDGGCPAHDRLGCPQCEFERSGRCYSELEENYGGTEW